MNMVKAIKGDDFNGYIPITSNGIEKKIYSKDSADFRKICHSPLKGVLLQEYPRPITGRLQKPVAKSATA
jgi:hypothetical protein